MVEDSTSSGPWASLHTYSNALAQTKWHTHQCPDSSEVNHKRPKKWVMAQFPEISAPSPETVGIIFPLITLWNYPAQEN